MVRVNVYKKIGMLLVVALLLLGLPVKNAQASTLQSLKDTLSDSRPSTVAVETFVMQLSASNVFAASETIVYDWPVGFTFPANGTWVTGDFTFNDGTSRTITSVGAAPTCNAGVNNVSVTADQTNLKLTVTACSTYTSSSSAATVTFTVGSTNKVTNATAGSYQINVDETTDDAKDTDIAIIGGVTVSATVDESLTHTTAGETTGNCPNPASAGSETEVDTSGDATTVPFGTVSTNAFYGACQKLTISTNASSGYSTTVQTTALLTSGSNTIAKGVCDASCSDTTEAAWATATNNGFGYCMSDSSGDAAATADAGWSSANNGCNSAGTTDFKTIANAGASDTARAIMSSATSVSSDVSYIKYRLSVSGSQAAGTYTTTAVYITTATF